MLHARASRLRLRFAPLFLLVAALVATGCGGDSNKGSLLSTNQASELRGTLNQVEQDVAAGNCTGAEEQVAALQDQIGTIKRIDGNLRTALRSSTRRLETLLNERCQAPTTTTTPTDTTPATPDQGATGASGTSGEAPTKEKKPKKDKTKPPGQEKTPPGQQGKGGGAGLPGEVNPNGNGGN